MCASSSVLRKGLLLDVSVRARISWLTLSRGRLEVDGHCLSFVQADQSDFGAPRPSRIEVPPSAFACLLLEPGTSITHDAIKLCAENKCLILWIGEGGTRIYSATRPLENPKRLLAQAELQFDARKKIEAARRLYSLMFNEPPPPSYSIEKLRGIEGAKVRSWYNTTCEDIGLKWDGRSSSSDLQQCINYATSCLYALSEIAIHTLGYSTSLGVVHSGDKLSFVYDLADSVKFSLLMKPLLQWFSESNRSDFQGVRTICRDIFREEKVLAKLIDHSEIIIGGQSHHHS